MMNRNILTPMMRDSAEPPTPTSGIYRSEQLGLISIAYDQNRITIADKNLGATQVYNVGDTLSQANCGYYYQRGNNYGFPRTGTVTTSSTRVNASTYGPGNYYSDSLFRTSYEYRETSNNRDLWGGVTGTPEAMRGPCPIGFHIPSNEERQVLRSIYLTLTLSGDMFYVYLKLPFTGFRDYETSEPFLQGQRGYYWSASAIENIRSARDVAVTSEYVRVGVEAYRGDGETIRPFKDEPVVPDSTWTKLF